MITRTGRLTVKVAFRSAASVNFDNAPGPHIIVSGNTSVNNAELVPEYRANAITDGEGIILDSNPGYTGGFLIQNNTTTATAVLASSRYSQIMPSSLATPTTGDLTNPTWWCKAKSSTISPKMLRSPTISPTFLHRPRHSGRTSGQWRISDQRLQWLVTEWKCWS